MRPYKSLKRLPGFTRRRPDTAWGSRDSCVVVGMFFFCFCFFWGGVGANNHIVSCLEGVVNNYNFRSFA
jgi:hypothetical protein